MPYKYRDAVVLIKKSPDGTIRRVNAIVLRSVEQIPNAPRSTALRAQNGVNLPPGEYLDLAFPRDLGGQEGTLGSVESVFSKAHNVPAWKEESWIGWQAVPKPSPDADKLKTFLLTNFKSETGNETPEACAIRLLGKKKEK